MAAIISFPYASPKGLLFLRANLSGLSPGVFRRQVVAVSGDGSSYWSSINSEIEAHLRRAIQIKPPLSVYEPLHHYAFAAPPRSNMAPALCVASYKLVGGQIHDEAVSVAAALRLLFSVSYIQEPFLDVSKSKSVAGEPYGPGIRLMTADRMMPFAMEMLARVDNPESENSARVLRVMIEAAQAIGSQGVVEGQYRETLRRKSSEGGCISKSGHVEEICGMSEKTAGVLHACSAACGAILAGGSEDEIERLRSYGLILGKIKRILDRNGDGKEYEPIMKVVDEMRDLAIKELSCFEGEKVEAVYWLIDVYTRLNHVV